MPPMANTQRQASPVPKWHFPPTGGGVETIQDSATTSFRDSPLDKFVREILQNSTDAHDHNAGPVEVTFAAQEYPTTDFGTEELRVHLEAAWIAAFEEGQESLAEQYQRAYEMLGERTIQCLNVSDRNTTGLSGDKWDALLIKAGAIRKDGPAPGGGNGIGKNAVFNISAAKTAFYYTCYQNGAGRKRHRVEKWMGKSMLTAHLVDGEMRQHIGFYRHVDLSPIEVPHIPEAFRMKTAPGQPNTPPSGTTITVVGFEPQDDDWPQEIAKSAAANFFYAIHHDKLIVAVIDADGKETRVDRNTLKNTFALHDQYPDEENPFSRAHTYYKAIQSQESPESIGMPTPVAGEVSLRMCLDGGPSRTVYINRNGMFITDSKDSLKNPFHVRMRQHCPAYTNIVTPSDDHTHDYIRGLEPPAHDEIQYNSIRNTAERNAVRATFTSARKQIMDLMNSKIQEDLESTQINLRELSGIIGKDADESNNDEGPLEVSTRKQNFQTASAVPIADDDPPTDDITPEPPEPKDPPVPPVEPPQPRKPRDPVDRPERPAPRNSRPSAIGNVRLVSASNRGAAVLFTTTRPGQVVKLQIAPSGEMESRESALEVIAASEDQSAVVSVHDNTVVVQADDARRYCVRISTNANTEKTALSVRNIV